MSEEKIKKNIYRTIIFFFALFLVLIAHITYLQIFEAAQLANHPLNHRVIGSNQERGRIIDNHGNTLAESKRTADGTFDRYYPQGALFCHVTGYASTKFGRTGIESYYNADLAGLNDPWQKLGPIAHLLGHARGNDIRLTINSDVQKVAAAALGGRKGAIVVLAPKTGAVIAMVSNPVFDPNKLEENWDSLSTNSESPLLNRAVQGLYPPGSVFKTLIADAAIKEKIADTSSSYNCPGYINLNDNYTIYESHRAIHGKVDLEDALAVSCNVTFAKLTLQLGEKRLSEAFSRFGFDKELTGEFANGKPPLPEFKKLHDGDLAQIGIGQGTLLVSPLRMALLASAFANNGVIMKPQLVDAVLTSSGIVLQKYQPEKWLEATSPDRASLLQQFMKTAVSDGTATRASVAGIDVTGKTGTAENSAGETHAWFIGSATIKNKVYSFAVIIENGGGGGSDAAPIVRKIITESLMN